MLKVNIKNFESVGNASFDIDGFTVIIGKNNIGKSAIIRAIDAALTNRTGSKFIRWGKTKCSVKLQKDNLDIDWQKGDSATYKISSDGGAHKEDFSKLNKIIPQPILDAGFRKIEIGDIKLTPLVAHQFKELFLIDKDTVVTDVLSVIYQLNLLSDADDLCQKDLRSSKSLLKTRQSDLSKVQKQLEIFKDFEDYKREFEDVKILDAKIKTLQKQISEIDLFSTELEQLQASIKSLGKITSVKIPSIGTFEKAIQKYSWLEEAASQCALLKTEVEKLGTVQTITLPEVNDTAKLIEKHRWVLETTLEMEAASRLYKSLKAISGIKLPEYAQIEKTFEEFREISKLSEDMRAIAGEMQSLSKITEVSTIDLNASLRRISDQIELWDQLSSLQLEFSSGILEMKEISAELTDTKRQLEENRQVYSQFKVCPTCGTSL